MQKNHKSFSIKIGIYRDISVQNRPLSAHFRPVTFWSRDWAPSNLVCINHKKHPYCAQISTLLVKWFLSYRRINKFSSSNSPFFYVVLCVNSRSRDLRSPKLVHMTLSLILMMSLNFSFLGLIVC